MTYHRRVIISHGKVDLTEAARLENLTGQTSHTFSGRAALPDWKITYKYPMLYLKQKLSMLETYSSFIYVSKEML